MTDCDRVKTERINTSNIWGINIVENNLRPRVQHLQRCYAFSRANNQRSSNSAHNSRVTEWFTGAIGHPHSELLYDCVLRGIFRLLNRIKVVNWHHNPLGPSFSAPHQTINNCDNLSKYLTVWAKLIPWKMLFFNSELQTTFTWTVRRQPGNKFMWYDLIQVNCSDLLLFVIHPD